MSSSAATRVKFVVALVAIFVQSAYIFSASLTLASSDVLAACVASGKGGKVPASAAAALTQSTCKDGYPCAETRDCGARAPGYCSRERPCTPCPDVWSGADAGCVACAASKNNGDCGFIAGYGCVRARARAPSLVRAQLTSVPSPHSPYCRFGNETRACTRCCTLVPFS